MKYYLCLGFACSVCCSGLAQHTPGQSLEATNHQTKVSEANKGSEAAKPAPLPNDWLLGAGSLEERDAIFEPVVRWIAAKGVYPSYFLGFRNFANRPIGENGSYYLLHDPTPDFLHRLKDLEPSIKPLSAAEWVPLETALPDGRRIVLGYEVAGHGVRCMIWGMHVASAPLDGADVDVEFETQKAGGKQHFTYHLQVEGVKWKVTEEKLVGILN